MPPTYIFLQVFPQKLKIVYSSITYNQENCHLDFGANFFLIWPLAWSTAV